jgi:hypothetical protein
MGDAHTLEALRVLYCGARCLFEEPAAEGILGTDTRGQDKQKIRIEQHTFMGTVWLAGWLFTIGFLHLALWKGVLAIVLWPYYLGAHFSSMAH